MRYKLYMMEQKKYLKVCIAFIFTKVLRHRIFHVGELFFFVHYIAEVRFGKNVQEGRQEVSSSEQASDTDWIVKNTRNMSVRNGI